MRNMLAFLAALTLAFVCTGWYLNWFSFRSSPSPTTGQRSVTVDFNTQKMAKDILDAEQKIQKNLAEKAKSANSTTSVPSERPAPKRTEEVNIPVIDFSGDN